MSKFKEKRKYEKRVEKRLVNKQSKKFLLGKLRQEWERIEEEAKSRQQRERIINLTKSAGKIVGFTLLAATALAGVIIIAAVAPNIVSAFGRRGRHGRYYDRRAAQERIWHLKNRGYIRVSERGDRDGEEKGKEIQITELGEKKLFKRMLGELRLFHPKKWDGIWRMVIFDIPDRHKWARDALRDRLKVMEFYALQESVFVSPFPCKEEVNFCISLFNVRGYVHLVETRFVSNDTILRNQFNL